jgi:hypothetical protein
MISATMDERREDIPARPSPEPKCAICEARPVIARCIECHIALCIEHVANLEAVRNNQWAVCEQHLAQVNGDWQKKERL